MIALDFETFLIAAGVLAPRPVCITWCREDMVPQIMHAEDPAAASFLHSVFSADRVVGANISFDLLVAAKRWPALLPVIFRALRESRIRDVQLDQRLIDIAQGQLEGYTNARGIYVRHLYSLAALSERYGLGTMAKGTDTWRLRYAELIDTSVDRWPAEARDYAMLDAQRTLQVHGAQGQYAEWTTDGPAQCRKAMPLHMMSDEGLHTDGEMCRTYANEVESSIQAAKRTILREGLLREKGTKDIKAAKARMVRVCEALEIPVVKTPKDGVSLSYESCRDSLDPVLQAYAMFAGADTMMKRVRKLSVGATQKLQTAFVVVQKNGRTASRTPGPPLVGENFQNLPAEGKLRECFVPPPGYYYNSVDFNQHELCTFAQVQVWEFGSSRLADAINSGRDVHSILAANLLGKSYDWVIENKKTFAVKRARDLAKRANFGLAGGMGIDRFMATINASAEVPADRVTRDTVVKLKGIWVETWDTAPYFKWVSSLVEHGPVALRQYISGRVRGLCDYCEFANGTFSGLAADAIGATLLPLAEAAYVDKDDPFYGSRPLLLIHDEVLSAVPIATASAAAHRQTDIMLSVAQKYTPDVKVSATPALMTKWYKTASAVYKNGVLAPYEPEAA